MPLPKDGEIQLFQVVDTDGNPARVSLIAGVYRLAVDALLVGPAGAYAQGDFDSVAVDEANALAMWVRAAVTGLDVTQPLGFRNVPIASRAALAAQAYTNQRLLVDGVIRGNDGSTYSAIASATMGGGTLADTLVALVVKAGLFAVDVSTSLKTEITCEIASSISGRLPSVFRALYTAAIATGLDNTGAAVLRPVEARSITNFDSVAASALIALLTQAMVSGKQPGTTTNRQVSAERLDLMEGVADSNITTLATASFVFGTEGSTARGVEARNADAAADFTEALVGLLVNSRNSILREDTDDWAIMVGNLMSSFSGRGLGINAQLVCSLVGGLDTTGAAVVRVPEARDFASAADVTSALIGVLVNSRLAALSEETGNWEQLGSIAPVPSNDRSALYVVEPRESGWLSSNLGRRFIATSQTAGAALTAQAAFVATTPTLMLRQSAGATETEVIRSISISSFAALPAGIRVVVMLDPDDRFSAGGTSVTPQNPNEGSAAASGITSFLENPTATAADADERIIYNEGFAGGIGAKLVIEFLDELILSGVGTLLVYVFDSAGAVAPTIAYNEEWEEYV